MKKISLFLLIISAVLLTSCAVEKDVKSLKSLTNNYTLAEAKADGCLVMENGSMTSGQSVFDDFYAKTQSNEDAFIRIANYYSLGDASGYDSAYYESVKDKYPVMFVSDVTYKGGKFTVDCYANNDDELFSSTFDYIIIDEITPREGATFTSATMYILVNDESLTWADIEAGLLSSQSGAAIEHYTVYQKRNYK